MFGYFVKFVVLGFLYFYWAITLADPCAFTIWPSLADSYKNGCGDIACTTSTKKRYSCARDNAPAIRNARAYDS